MAVPSRIKDGLSRALRGTASLALRVLNFAPSSRYDSRAFISGLADARNTWGDFPDRVQRYEIYGAIWEGSIYKKAHLWAALLKLDHGLYEHIRSIRSPGKRVVDFWGSKTYPGVLDLDAGDGKDVPSACPILAEDPTLRPLISRLWKDSVWQVNKDIYARLGACHGDVFLQGVDDPRKGRVYFVVREAKTVFELSKDARGNVVGYTILEERDDPEAESAGLFTCPPPVLYVEECWRGEGELVWFRTSIVRNGQDEPYDFREYADGETPVGPQWSQPYGFVPLVHVQNRDVGKGWGWSVYQGSGDKLLEVDDGASKVHDYFRKVVDNYWFVTGAQPGDIVVGGGEDEQGNSRDDQGLIYGPKDASITAMIAPLNIADASKHLDSYDSVIVQDFPELMAEDVSPAASGESRRVAREKVEAEVVQHRSPYDAGLVSMHKMLISMWIAKGYDGLPAGLTADSYRDGELDHAIGDRPVFAVSEAHRLETATARSDIVAKLVNLGQVPLEFALRAAEYPEDFIRAAVKAQQAEADAANERERVMQVTKLAVDPEEAA